MAELQFEPSAFNLLFVSAVVAGYPRDTSVLKPDLCVERPLHGAHSENRFFVGCRIDGPITGNPAVTVEAVDLINLQLALGFRSAKGPALTQAENEPKQDLREVDFLKSGNSVDMQI